MAAIQSTPYDGLHLYTTEEKAVAALASLPPGQCRLIRVLAGAHKVALRQLQEDFVEVVTIPRQRDSAPARFVGGCMFLQERENAIDVLDWQNHILSRTTWVDLSEPLQANPCNIEAVLMANRVNHIMPVVYVHTPYAAHIP
ncbi:MAG: hypothetical protein H7A36_07110 [Chlamydiales bacterium]|nr:hypothetical protein [Chlamydiales bacterium]